MSVRQHKAVRASSSSSSKRRGVVTAVTSVTALAVLGGLATGGAFTTAQAKEDRAGDVSSQASYGGKRNQALQKAMDDLVRKDGFPGVLASVKGRDGRTVDYTAGVADLKTKEKVPVNGRVRAGSNTKSFVAAVVLQLVGEGKVKLDEPIETYLPGLLRGEGIDGNDITVRHLLQHTSGLPSYTRYMEQNAFKTRDNYTEPRELIDSALKHKADFAPGEKGRWAYSNTGYVVLGLLIQKATGRPVAEEITNRIIRPLGLKDTYWPGVGERGIRGTHPKGYDAPKGGEPLQDITRMDPSWGWAAGQIISSPRDLNTFFSALFGGKVLRPAEMKELRKSVKTVNSLPNSRYGLGVMHYPLSCGGDLWGHGGDIQGYETRGGVTSDGRQVTLAVTALPTALAAEEEKMLEIHQNVLDAVDTALCKK